jgi:hydrophobe/amphiphile efflux-1 (HAE1) family protein
MSDHRGIASWSIRRPIGTVTLTSVILVLGWLFVARLPLDLLPRIVYPQIRVGVSNPGVEPGVLEETVAKPLETALATTEGLTLIETSIQEGSVGVELHFAYGTDIDVALQNAATNLNRARSQLPLEAEPPTIGKSDPTQAPIYEVAFSSPSRDLVSLRAWIEDRLRPQLLTVSGVASVDISGGLVREVQVTLDPERLQGYGMTVSQVIAALRAQNQDVAAGRISGTDQEVVGKTTGRFRTVTDMRQLRLPVGNGQQVPLSDVATIEDTHQEQRLWARLNGVPAIKVSIRKQPDGNTVSAADQVDARLRELARNSFIPSDVEYRVIQNQAGFIRNSVNAVRNSALLGAGLSMLVVLLFLQSLRKTLVIGLAIPIAVLATLVLMGLAGLTLNIMSLGGLALGVGMLVDNAIVMLENIFRKRDEEGVSDPVEAAHVGAAEVATAVVASTTTNLAAVLPFLLVTGLAALVFRELILTISFAILASLGAALTLVPMLAAQMAKVKFSSGIDRLRFMRAFDHLMQRARRGYRRAAERSLRARWLVLGSAVAALALAAYLTRDLGSEFLPQVDDGGVGAFVRLPPGSTPQQTNEVTREVERLVESMPFVENVFTTAGGFLFGGGTANRAGRGSLDIRLVSPGERDMSADQWVQQLQDKIRERGFPGARVFVRPPRIRGLRTSSSGSDLSIAIQGDDLLVLQRLSQDVAQRLRGTPGLENMEASAEEATPTLSIRLDRDRAAQLGLDVATVGQTLRTALDGTVATRYAVGNREIDVRVQFDRRRFTSPEDLGAVALFPAGGGGAPVMLRDIATVSTELGPTDIQRESQIRQLRISGDVITEVASAGDVADSVRARLADFAVPDGYALLVGGEDEAIRENNRQLTIVALLAVFLVFVVLATQYESVLNPLVILLAIPLSLIGVGFTLWVTGTALSAPVLLGVILLAGLVVNNAILLVEYIEEYRSLGTPALEAVMDAGAVRLRPILMTTTTTLFGMLPLALGMGEGSELMQPLAITVVGGLSVSTLLTLFVVPSAYLIVHEVGDRVKTWLTGEPTATPLRGGMEAHGELPAGD